MARRQTGHGKVLTRVAHWLAETVVGDIAEAVEVAVNKQHRLAQPAAIRRLVRVGDVGAVVQIPGVSWPESGDAEGFEQTVKVSGRPEGGIRLYGWSMMRGAEPTSIARDDRRAVHLAHGFEIPAAVYRREACRDVRIEVSDRLVEMSQVEAVAVPTVRLDTDRRDRVRDLRAAGDWEARRLPVHRERR